MDFDLSSGGLFVVIKSLPESLYIKLSGSDLLCQMVGNFYGDFIQRCGWQGYVIFREGCPVTHQRRSGVRIFSSYSKTPVITVCEVCCRFLAVVFKHFLQATAGKEDTAFYCA